MKPVNIAIVGATGAVGEAVVELLEKRKFPVDSLYLLASDRTAGTSLMFNNKPVMVTELSNFDFAKVQLAIFVATDSVSAESVPLAQAKGCLVIDNSQVYADSAPLVVPQVNGEILGAKPLLVVNPDSNAIQLSTVLKPIYDQVGIARVNVTVLQSVSGHGKKAIHELVAQTASLLNGRGAETGIYPQQVAFNVLPYVGAIDENGYSDAERRLLTQTRRLLGDSQLQLNISCVQVPVFYADSMTVAVDTVARISPEQMHDFFKNNNEISVLDGNKPKNLATPVTHATGKEKIFISRIRRDMSNERGINLWVTTDNVRKSAAFNTILIAEELIKSYL
jgi:aspartate-semialdehyde dehydrogenase